MLSGLRGGRCLLIYKSRRLPFSLVGSVRLVMVRERSRAITAPAAKAAINSDLERERESDNTPISAYTE